MAETEPQFKVAILSELWQEYRQDEDFKDFFEYNDLGLPLAYAIDFDLVVPNDIAYAFIDETFDLLLASLGIPNDEYAGLDDLFERAEKENN